MRTRNHSRHLAAMMGIVLAVLTGCSGRKPGPTVRAFLTPEPAATVTLRFESATTTIAAHIEGVGFAARSEYELQIRRGSCLKPGRLLYAFSPMTSRDNGITDANVKAGQASGIPRGIHLELHLMMGPGSTTAEPIESACADVPDRTPTKTLALFPPPKLRSGGSFTAFFKDARTLSLQMTLLGLQPDSVHAVQIYRGQCAAQGTVDTRVGDVSADAAGSAGLKDIVRLNADGGAMFVGVTSGPASRVDTTQAKPIDTQLILCGDLPSRPK